MKQVGISGLITVCTLLALVFSMPKAQAAPVTFDYTGEMDVGSDGVWQLEWYVDWKQHRGLPLKTAWVDISDTLTSDQIISQTASIPALVITTPGKNYYVGTANDPFGVPEGDRVLLWSFSGKGGLQANLAAEIAAPSEQLGTVEYGLMSYKAGNTHVGKQVTGTTLGLTPEPSTLLVLLLGLGGGAWYKRRRK